MHAHFKYIDIYRTSSDALTRNSMYFYACCCKWLVCCIAFIIHLVWSACAQLKGDDIWCGFAFIYGLCVIYLSWVLFPPPSAASSNFSTIYRIYILLSLSLPWILCLCCIWTREFDYDIIKMMKNSIKRDGKLN